jgi:SAM-dependent methyltransferase
MVLNEQTVWLDNLAEADRYNEWIIQQIAPYLQGNVLEFGCGTGNFTSTIARYAERVIAVDIVPQYVDAVRCRCSQDPKVEVHCLDILQQDWPSEFDCIVMLDVLEHIEHDVDVLHQLAGMLKPKGSLLIKVPAMGWLYNSLDQAIGHYRRYGKHTLQTVVETAGLRADKLWYFNALGIAGWWLNGSLLKKTVAGGEQVGIFNKLVPALAVIESFVDLPLGLSVYCVASHHSA